MTAAKRNGNGLAVTIPILAVVVALFGLGWKSLDARVCAVEQQDVSLARIEERVVALQEDVRELKDCCEGRGSAPAEVIRSVPAEPGAAPLLDAPLLGAPRVVGSSGPITDTCAGDGA